MKKTLITLLVTGLLAANAQAAGQDNTWYGGAKLGWSNFYSIDESNNFTLGNETNDALGAGVFVGYQANKNLGIEYGYDYLGKYKYDARSATGAAFQDEVQAQLIHLSLKLGFPVTDSLDLYGRIGGGYAAANSDLKGGTAGSTLLAHWVPSMHSTSTGLLAWSISTPHRMATVMTPA